MDEGMRLEQRLIMEDISLFSLVTFYLENILDSFAVFVETVVGLLILKFQLSPPCESVE